MTSTSIKSQYCSIARGVFACLLFAGFGFAESFADQHTAGVPGLNSRPGAEYTVYLDVAGFNYDGDWRPGKTPGTTLAVNDRAATDTFTTAEQEQIKIMWSRLAQSYIGLNVNVTTIDPAVAASQAATDAQRQAFYDAQPNLLHTVVGSQVRAGGVKWYSDAADGVSGLGVVAGVTGIAGDHTNWMFSEAQAGAATGGVINGDYIGAISAHENAHAFGLKHQGDWTGETKVNEYSNGDAAPGNGTYVPIIGNASDRQRVTWRVGDTDNGGAGGLEGGGTDGTRVVINDVQSMLQINNVSNGRTGTANLHLVADGIGHTRLTASTLPMLGNGTVDFSLATGVIVPVSESNPLPLGVTNYTQDWFSFTLAAASTISLTVHDGTQFLTAGVADGVGTLRSTLAIFDGVGTLISTGIEDSSTLFETYNGTLGSGTYFAQVGSFGGHQQDSPAFNAAAYYDMGAYFITGSGLIVPEPGTLVFLSFGVICIGMRRRRSDQ